MAISHAKPAEVIDVSPLGERLAQTQTATLIKTDALEVIRLVVPAGKEIAQHEVQGEITLQCLEGTVEVTARGASRKLSAGQLLYLVGGDAHSLSATDDSSLLLTILLPKKEA